MICKNCGADIGNKGKCEYCDTVYFEKFNPQEAVRENRKNKAVKEKSGTIKVKITFPTKIALVIWFLCCLINLPDIKAIGYFQYACVALLGFLFFGGITQLISARYKKRHTSTDEKPRSRRTKLTLPTKIVSIIWLMCCLLAFTEIESLGYLEYAEVALLGFLIYGGITQLISTRIQKHRTSNPTVQTLPAKIHNIKKPYDQMDKLEFQLYCAYILDKCGFTGISVTKLPENQGIDLIAFYYGMRYGIQCRCSSSDIGLTAVQQALAGKAFYECHMVTVMTNRYFTDNAKELAEKNNISLWDRDLLDSYIAGIERKENSPQ